MKRRTLEWALLLVFVAVAGRAFFPAHSAPIPVHGYAVGGAQLYEEGYDIQGRLGKPVRQLEPRSRDGKLRRHIYASPWGEVDVLFDDPEFFALDIRGQTLTLDGRELLRVGDPVEKMAELGLAPQAEEVAFSEKALPPPPLSAPHLTFKTGDLTSIRVASQDGRITELELHADY